jgi:hypothetical protein
VRWSESLVFGPICGTVADEMTELFIAVRQIDWRLRRFGLSGIIIVGEAARKLPWELILQKRRAFIVISHPVCFLSVLSPFC